MNPWVDELLRVATDSYRTGHLAEAEALLRLLIGRGRDMHALSFTGHLACLLGRPADAVWFLTCALELNPDHAPAHNDLGEALCMQGEHAGAEAHFRRAIALEPDIEKAHGNLAMALLGLNRVDDAVHAARTALRLATDQSVAQADLGRVLRRLNRPDDALRHFDQALALNPENHRAGFWRGLARLSLGDLPDAWDDYERRLNLPPAMIATRTYPRPRWRRDMDVAGRTVLVYPEHGFADALQFVRYVPLLRDIGAQVVLEIAPGLVPLCRFPGVTVIAAGTALPDFDLHCPLNSLPALFRTDLATIPADTPYLTVDAGVSAAWAGRLGPWNRMRVGLAWSAARDGDGLWSGVPPALLAPLLDRTDIECHAMQRDPARDGLPDAAEVLVDHTEALTDDSRLAGLLANMDLVISADNDIAHLAGALNIPTWVMLPHSADWRWLREREDSPWYPSLRLFRQKRRGDWNAVLAAVGRNLDQWAIRRS